VAVGSRHGGGGAKRGATPPRDTTAGRREGVVTAGGGGRPVDLRNAQKKKSKSVYGNDRVSSSSEHGICRAPGKKNRPTAATDPPSETGSPFITHTPWRSDAQQTASLPTVVRVPDMNQCTPTACGKSDPPNAHRLKK
jgi:hypothetical protein